MTRFAGATSLLFLLALAGVAHAQQAPPLPPPTPPPPGSEPPPSPTYAPPQPQPRPPPPNYPPPPPPPPGSHHHRAYEVVEPAPPTHAPYFSLWTGARLGLLSFSGAFYTDEAGHAESTGNYAKPGLSLEADVGARIARRYVPYVFLEHGFMGQGHRFEGSDATTQTNLYGLGFRYTAFDVDNVGVLADLSFGFRSLTVSSGNQSYTMHGLEIFRFGLGAEIRMSTLFVLSPLLSISSGTMTEADGNIQFSGKGSQDGLTHPTFNSSKSIDAQNSYLMLMLSVGGHFDLFGR